MVIEKLKKELIDSGLWTWLIVIIPILLCLLFMIFPGIFSNSTPIVEPGYTGACHHWSEAERWANQNNCIWGIPTSTAVGSWVWLHFSERSYPFPDFAADIDDYIGGDIKFTANNISEKYVGHCVEVYGEVKIESNTYNGKTVEQPVIHVNSANDIKLCDEKLTGFP